MKCCLLDPEENILAQIIRGEYVEKKLAEIFR